MFTKTMNVTRCSVEKESEKYNIFIFSNRSINNFIRNFFIIEFTIYSIIIFLTNDFFIIRRYNVI